MQKKIFKINIPQKLIIKQLINIYDSAIEKNKNNKLPY